MIETAEMSTIKIVPAKNTKEDLHFILKCQSKDISSALTASQTIISFST
jgi:hypothetical protein